MLAGFYVFHKKGYTGHEAPPQGAHIYSFKTCLRQIYLAYFDEAAVLQVSRDFDVYRDKKAYQFLLEVVCGLHSPVIGETEVFGQFKTFWQTNEFFYPLRQIMDSLITDAKKIRGQHLKNLGGQSYGSVIRKMLKSPAQVAVIGSGSLVQDILPWIYKDENQISLFARNLAAAQDLQARHEKIKLRELTTEAIDAPVVIIAAPLSAAEIHSLIINKDALVIDLRGESSGDRCTQFKNYKDLSAFFQTIEKNQFKITQAKTVALSAIGDMSQQRFNTESLRPFGWDDMRLVIGSRQSDLARIQAYAVGDALKKKNPELEIEYKFRESLGDKNLTDPLWKMPERGVFTEDFHRSLLIGDYDLVVHSWKDLPVEDRSGTEILATLPREDMRDVLLLKKSSLAKTELAIFTSSPRRVHNLSQSLKDLLPMQPSHLKFEPVRGNVQTRVRKLTEGSQDGLVVAKAALDRLLSAERDEFTATRSFLREALAELQWMVLPLTLNPAAAAQGALAVEARVGRDDLKKVFSGIHCESTFACVSEERRILKGWGGGCHQKIGIAIFDRPYGRVVFARGVRDNGDVIDRRELIARNKIFNEGSASPLVDGWFDRFEVAVPAVNDVDAHWVSKAEALPRTLSIPAHHLTWVSGLATWRALAARGIWVNGSSESLGEQEERRTEVLDGQPRAWGKWTHAGGEPLVQGKTFMSYKLVPKKDGPTLDERHQHFFWKSGSVFLAALAKYPWLAKKDNWSGPGHTHGTIAQAMADRSTAHIALSFEEWQKLMKQGKSP